MLLTCTALSYAALLLLGLQTKLGPGAAPDLPADDLLERTPLTAPSVAAQSEVSRVKRLDAADNESIEVVLRALGERRYMVVEARFGLGNRIRTLASAMSVAAVLGRPLALVWARDRHCNCSFRSLFRTPFPFLLLETSLWPEVRRHAGRFQVYNYMHGEEGAEKGAPIVPDPARHLYFRSAFLMNHSAGAWGKGAWYLQHTLAPHRAIASQLIASRSMVGLHVRSVIVDSVIRSTRRPAAAAHGEARRAAASSAASWQQQARSTAALSKGALEYGHEGFEDLKRWRNATQPASFLPRMREILQARPGTRFYLAADAEATYAEVGHAFPPGVVLSTPRTCEDPRACDARDCEGVAAGLVDLLNLARTGRMLGSVGSSYSEVAAYLGASEGVAGSAAHGAQAPGCAVRSAPRAPPPHCVCCCRWWPASPSSP